MREDERRGDTIPIPGDYQATALKDGISVQRFWHSQKLQIIKKICPPMKDSTILDIGCGSGVVSNYLAAHGRWVDAVDGNPAAIEYARSQNTCDNLQFHLVFADALPFALMRFDRVYALELIEHMERDQIQRMLSHLREMMVPGGLLLLTTPNYHSLWPAIEWTMDHFHLAPRMKGNQHVTKFTENHLILLLKESSFEIVYSGRFCGLAPFASIISWKIAERINRIEDILCNPMGNLLVVLAKVVK